MSDPRGHGFKRGNGRWHSPIVSNIPLQPSDFGWKPTITRRPFQIVWIRGNWKLTGSRRDWHGVNELMGAEWDFPNQTIAEVTEFLFGIPIDGMCPGSPAEITMAEWYGVSQ